MARRAPLTVERIITAAVAVADRGGLPAVSMRNVGAEPVSRRCRSTTTSPTGRAALGALVDWLFRQLDPAC